MSESRPTHDLKHLTPMDPAVLAAQADTIAWRAVVKLHPGHDLPTYVVERSRLPGRIFTVDLPVGTWSRITQDPAIESVSLSRATPVWSEPSG